MEILSMYAIWMKIDKIEPLFIPASPIKNYINLLDFSTSSPLIETLRLFEKEEY